MLLGMRRGGLIVMFAILRERGAKPAIRPTIAAETRNLRIKNLILELPTHNVTTAHKFHLPPRWRWYGPRPMITLILALADNGVIGRNGAIPWRITDDLKRFKALTMGKTVVMGRKTWDSLPKKPLPDRRNIVVTRQPGWKAEGASRRRPWTMRSPRRHRPPK